MSDREFYITLGVVMATVFFLLCFSLGVQALEQIATQLETLNENQK